MKVVNRTGIVALMIAAIFSMAALAQKPELRSKVSSAKAEDAQPTATPDTDVAADGSQDSPEAEAILPYYNNYLKEYRLGPADVISVEVFGQCPDYCKTGITVPPNAKISYPLVRDGIMVAGKTVEQVADDITKKLDEYIIDPKVTVTLDKAVSTRYSVMGKVVTPGVKSMDRKISVYEAILDAGGVAKGGDKKKAYIVSYNTGGGLTKREISIADMESGKSQMVFLNPGDQVFVPSKGFSVDTFFDVLGKVSVVRFLFGSPF